MMNKHLERMIIGFMLMFFYSEHGIILGFHGIKAIFFELGFTEGTTFIIFLNLLSTYLSLAFALIGFIMFIISFYKYAKENLKK